MDWATLDTPSIRERAASALEKRNSDRMRNWEDELANLYDDALIFFNNKLLFSNEELDDFQTNSITNDFDPKRLSRRPNIIWERDGIKFKVNYVSEEVATIQTDGGTKNEKIYDLSLVVLVENKSGAFKRIENLADIAEILN